MDDLNEDDPSHPSNEAEDKKSDEDEEMDDGDGLAFADDLLDQLDQNEVAEADAALDSHGGVVDSRSNSRMDTGDEASVEPEPFLESRSFSVPESAKSSSISDIDFSDIMRRELAARDQILRANGGNLPDETREDISIMPIFEQSTSNDADLVHNERQGTSAAIAFEEKPIPKPELAQNEETEALSASPTSTPVAQPLLGSEEAQYELRLVEDVDSETQGVQSSTASRNRKSRRGTPAQTVKSTKKDTRKRPARSISDADSSFGDAKDDDGSGKKIRRSTRDIKRPKFDDELVESGVRHPSTSSHSSHREVDAQSFTPMLGNMKVKIMTPQINIRRLSTEVIVRHGYDPASNTVTPTTYPVPESLTDATAPSSRRSSLTGTPKLATPTLIDQDIYAQAHSLMTQRRASHAHEASTSASSAAASASNSNPASVAVPNNYQEQMDTGESAATQARINSKTQAAAPPSPIHMLRKRNTKSFEDRQAYEDALMEEEAARIEKRRREARIASKDIRAKELQAAADAEEAQRTKDLAKWPAKDDVALITAVSHVNDLRAVWECVCFSQVYTRREIEERWYALLYDESLAKQAKLRMTQLLPEELLRIQSDTAFTLDEQDILSLVPPDPMPTIQSMSEVLKANQQHFHSARTPQVLLDHWHRMNRVGLLAGSEGSTRVRQPIRWATVENHPEACNDDMEFDDSRPFRSLAAMEKMRFQVESALAKVTTVPVVGIQDTQPMNTVMLQPAVASIRGRVVKYLVRSDRVVMGRSTPTYRAEVNLALEGPAAKISRKQALIEKHAGQFYIMNTGRRPIYVDGKALAKMSRCRLQHMSIIELATLRFVFRLESWKRRKKRVELFQI